MQRENEILAILDDLTNRVIAIASDAAYLKKSYDADKNSAASPAAMTAKTAMSAGSDSVSSAETASEKYDSVPANERIKEFDSVVKNETVNEIDSIPANETSGNSASSGGFGRSEKETLKNESVSETTKGGENGE